MTTKATAIEIPEPNVKRMKLLLIGDTGLVTHEWSDKKKKEMLGIQTQTAASQTREKRNPDEEYLGAFFKIPTNGRRKKFTIDNIYKDWLPGFPIICFKAAAVGACRQLKGNAFPMTLARQVIFVLADEVGGDLLPIDSDKPFNLEKMVRLKNGSSDFRWRPQFDNWRATITVEFDADCVSAEQVVNLFNRAGRGGVGELRPGKSNSGDQGRFHVARQGEEVKKKRRRSRA